jgi:CheY-like chemotaxis protein
MTRSLRPRLLLVEDQDAARMASSELLDELGYDVLAVPSGGAALAACRDGADAFDVVVTDVGLPDFSGIEVARKIRLISRGVGVVFLSGKSGDDTALVQMLDEANTAFVQKPVEIARLARTIDSVLAASQRGRTLRFS